jgi:hypothetical protein
VSFVHLWFARIVGSALLAMVPIGTIFLSRNGVPHRFEGIEDGEAVMRLPKTWQYQEIVQRVPLTSVAATWTVSANQPVPS